MNKLLYRIVFNKARGMLMVVSELARGCSGSAPSSGISHNHQRLICRIGAISLGLWLASGAIAVQAAGIVADQSAPNKQQATIISTANGTPQVNIQTPSPGGVSRNTYSQFDVGQNGVILNNSHKNTATQLGGMVAANPWLAKGEAKIILNEVNARNPSQLNGFIEVAGQKADVVIASPSGITCNGCGFINAGRATLTTGTAQMQNGKITGYQVEKGEIHINGNGLDSTGQNHTDIIGRAVKVNAAIHAQDLRVTTGRNRVDAAHEQIDALADNGTAKPSLALDVSQVGGMYAGKIRLRGTEKGVGVRNAGNIGAEAGMVTLSADGQIQNSGAVWSSEDIAISGTAEVQNSGSIAAQHNVSLTGKTITNTGTLAAGVQPDGTMGSGGDLMLSASGKLELHGRNLAGGNLNASGRGLDASGSLTQAKNITLNAGQGDLSTASAQIVADDTLSAITSGTHDNRSGLLAAGKLTLTAKALLNQKGQISQSGTEALALNQQGGIDNRDGMIAANAAITVNTASLDNRKGHILAAETGSLSLQTTGGVDNHEGVLAAAQNVSVTTDTLRNDDGLISAENGHIALTSKNQVTNVGGQIAARSTLALDSGALNNDEGLIQSGAGMAINTHGSRLSNKYTLATGGIVSVGELNIHASAIDNQLGAIHAGGALNASTETLDNTQGVLVSGDNARLETAGIVNQQGTLVAQRDLSLTAQRLDNDSGGLVQSGGDLTLNSEHISNRDSGDAGGIVSQGNMSITTNDLQNNTGVVLAGKGATVNAARFSNIAGKLVALEALKLATQSDTDNREGIIQGAGISLDTHGHLLNNQQGTLYSLAAMQLATGELNNQNGTLGAKGDVTLKATSLDNRTGGRVVSEQAITLDLERVDNQQGEIQSLGNLMVNAVSGLIDNTLGLMRSGATVTLHAASLVNRNTQAAEKGIEGLEIKIVSQQLDNTQGTVLSGDTLDIANAGTLDNTQGELSAAGELSLSGAALRLVNTGGVTLAGEKATIDAEELTGDGRLLSLGEMTINTRQAFDNQGDVIANDNLTFTTLGSVTNSGNLLAGEKLNFSAASLLNTTTGEIAAGATWLTVTADLNNYGLIDGSQTWLKAGTLTNAGTGRIYGDHLSLQAATLNNLAQGEKAATIAGRQRVDIGADTINNRDHALIYSNGALAIGGQVNENGFATGQARTLNNHSATIESAGDMILSVSQLNNINDHFSTEMQWISTEQMHEYQHKGSPDRWDASTEGVFVDRNSADKLLNLNTPDDTGANNDNFYEYNYTRTIEEEVIVESDPGKILSGGQMVISANHVLNDKSQIVAGGTLGIFADTVDNVMPEGSRWISDEGSVTHYSRKSKKGGDSQGKSTSDYVPPTVIQSITLSPGRMDGNSQAEGSGMTLSPATARGTDAVLNGTGDLSVGVDVASPESPASDTSGKWIETPASGAENGVIRAIAPDTRLPDTSLFNTLPAPEAHYLIETDPRFTNNKMWLGSDYMQDAFALNHDNMHKRLGDGYYEQRLVREQIIALTGGRYLGDHRDDETQFRALMDAGIAFGKAHQLIPGVALTAEQMSLLTEDMVWLVNTRVQLADGSWQTVMVPQVYVRVQPGDVNGSGALMGGQNVVMNLNRDLVNSGTLHGREVVQLSADMLTNRAGTIQGADVSLLARTDINNIGGTISGHNSVLATAGRDINLTTTTRSAESTTGKNSFERTTIERVAGIYVQGDDGKLVLNAGQDLNLTAAQVVNSGSDGQTILNAGRDLNLATVTTSASDNLTWDKDNWLKQATLQQAGSEVAGESSLLMMAGRDVNAEAASVEAGKSLGVSAGRDISIVAATDRSEFESHHKSTRSSSAFSKKTITTHDVVNSETAQGSLFSGDSVTMQAGRDLLVQGSDVVGDNDLRLSAQNNLTITTAEERSQESHKRQEKRSGFSGTGGIGFSYGSNTLKVTDDAQNVSHRGSTIGSVNGDVTLTAGNALQVNGSDLVAGHDMTLAGKDVRIVAATESSSQTHTVEQKSSGLTLALSGSAGSALDSAVRTTTRASEADSGRLAALQAVKAGLYGVQTSQALRLDQATGDQKGNDNTVGISLSYGSQSSKTTQTREQTHASGSSLTAGNNLTVVATDGDVLVQGSSLAAENDMLIQASRDVNLISAQNTSRLDGKNESHGGSAGVGIGYGSGGAGINFSAGLNAGKGKEKGNSTTYTETTLNTGNNLVIVSGRDTTLRGAQASGEHIVADVGRNLTLQSQQDTDSYNSTQKGINAGGNFSLGTMTGSGGISASRDKMDSDYKSVQEQTGLFAGDGGFDIRTGGHTQLDGAVIASTAAAENNRLDTGTLGWRDIRNHAEYSVEHQSAGFSSGGASIDGQFTGNMASNLLAGINNHDSAESTTRSAVAQGDIIIRDPASQTQDTARLSRDTANANDTVGVIFDKAREQRRLDEAQLISDIGGQMSDIARTEGQIAQQKAMKDPAALRAAEEQLRAGGNASPTPQEIAEQAGRTAMAEYGTGSDIQRAIQAATAAVKGAAGGDLSAALAGAAAPYVAEVIGHRSGLEDGMEKAAAHAVANAALAAMQGQSALAGAAGAVAGELAGSIAKEMYGKEVAELSESQKQTISSLATIAAGIAGGLAGDGTAAAVAGGQGGKTVVENNSLAHVLAAIEANKPGTVDSWTKEQQEQIREACSGGTPVSCETAVAAMGSAMAWPLLPGAAATTSLIGAGANAGVGMLINHEINPNDVILGYWTGALTAGTGLWGTMAVNAGSGATSSYLKEDDPLIGGAMSGMASGLGYGAGKVLQGQLDKFINPNWKNWGWVDVGMGISKPLPLDPLPGVAGNIFGSGTTEFSNDQAGKWINVHSEAQK
ncbi:MULTISPECIES: hemagglutinin repeat-containing protein [Leclercia]|uniref:hemagglutinin repeat-containing protein n=1 Tax=Leclercia TaxID=83654 RepID=UPI0012E96833|nr:MULTISPECIES: hemagglutinin repeat-containing protein [Leclercia]QGW19196.1 filamentous hemagglutinin N-terminal domain-containing protein [Leclercia sp. Colony189]URM22897.1 hemagglutinin repeat-containing protein [Leclercia adecarboxylata]